MRRPDRLLPVGWLSQALTEFPSIVMLRVRLPIFIEGTQCLAITANDSANTIQNSPAKSTFSAQAEAPAETLRTFTANTAIFSGFP